MNKIASVLCVAGKLLACYSSVIIGEIGARLICNPYLSERTAICRIFIALFKSFFDDRVEFSRDLKRLTFVHELFAKKVHRKICVKFNTFFVSIQIFVLIMFNMR